jgi:hypothetical protein
LFTMVLPAVSVSASSPSTVVRYESDRLEFVEGTTSLEVFTRRILTLSWPGSLVHFGGRLRLGRVRPLGGGLGPGAFHQPDQGSDIAGIYELLSLVLICFLCQIPDGKQLGEWVGLAKLDREGKPRKVVKCSCAVVSLVHLSLFIFSEY